MLQGTYYGLGSDNQGACGYGPSAANSTSMPWSTGTALTVAINDDQYSGGITCGICIKFRGTGTGIGTQPIPQTWQYALVTNRCVASSHHMTVLPVSETVQLEVVKERWVAVEGRWSDSRL